MSTRLRPDQVPLRLATPNVAFEQRIRQAFDHALNGELTLHRDATSGDVTADVDVLTAGGTGVVVLGPGVDAPYALEVAAAIDRGHPDVVVLLVAEPTTELLRDALRAGARDVISPDAPAPAVQEALVRARHAAAQRTTRIPAEADRPNRIISVLSPKGGAGKTTIAANLAVGLAQTAPEQVVLVDLDLQFGDAASALQLVPEHSIADAVRSPDDTTLLKVFLTAHPAGLYVLCAPDNPADADALTSDDLAGILDRLADEFRYVVVDTPAGVTDQTLAVAEVSTDLVLLATMDVASVRSLRKEVAVLDQLGITGPQRHFVLNRADSKVGLDPDDVAATVGVPVDVALPSTRAIPTTVNLGTPVITAEPTSPVAQRLVDLVNRFADQPVARSGGGLFGWLRS